MDGWARLADAPWQRFEGIFNVQRTPPIVYTEPRVPSAPRKPRNHVRRVGMKPRKLTYEHQENAKRPDEKPAGKAWVEEDSGIALWATTSSALRDEDVDKENRPESENISPNSQRDIIGSLRGRLNRLMSSKYDAYQFE